MKIRNVLKYFLHQITRQIVEDNDIIVTEALNINQKEIYQIDRYYLSSQEFPRRRYRNKESKDLRIRKQECLDCQIENGRGVLMEKIIIIGCPGSGKSTFAKKLNKILKYPLYHLDLIWNKPDKTIISREEFDLELDKIFNEDKWIMDGN